VSALICATRKESVDELKDVHAYDASEMSNGIDSAHTWAYLAIHDHEWIRLPTTRRYKWAANAHMYPFTEQRRCVSVPGQRTDDIEGFSNLLGSSKL
jgi:hypothetical protein